MLRFSFLHRLDRGDHFHIFLCSSTKYNLCKSLRRLRSVAIAVHPDQGTAFGILVSLWEKFFTVEGRRGPLLFRIITRETAGSYEKSVATEETLSSHAPLSLSFIHESEPNIDIIITNVPFKLHTFGSQKFSINHSPSAENLPRERFETWIIDLPPLVSNAGKYISL